MEDLEPSIRPAAASPSGSASLESTAELVEEVRRGDNAARDRLVARYLPALRNWSHGRLPARARDLADTDDLVQIALIRALNQIGSFEPKREGSFLAYLRQIVLNQVRDEIRRAARRGEVEALEEKLVHDGPSPLEQAIGRETLERYEAGLARLTELQQEAVILRIEMDFTYPEIARALGQPSANAARMLVARGLVRLAEAMNE